MLSIEELKEKAVPVAKEFGIDELSLFGSYARNEQKEDSDVDFYILENYQPGIHIDYATGDSYEEN